LTRDFGSGNQNAYGGGWEYGFQRGMYSYNTMFPYNNMMESVPKAVSACLDQVKGRPFFMYLHTNDTHEPFMANEPFTTKWGNGYRDRYEGEISYVDHYFGLLLDELRKRRLLDRTLIVVTSDHGTEFGEHGFREKVLNLYEEIIRIPLIMRLPGILPARKVVRGLCQTIDVAPTILDICGLPIPEETDGRSLLPRIRGKGKAVEVVFAHTLNEKYYSYELFCARAKRYKFIRCAPFRARPDKMPGSPGKRFARLLALAEKRAGVLRELYDLKKDPGEQRNVIRDKPQIAQQLERKLNAWIRGPAYRPRKSGLRGRLRQKCQIRHSERSEESLADCGQSC